MWKRHILILILAIPLLGCIQSYTTSSEPTEEPSFALPEVNRQESEPSYSPNQIPLLTPGTQTALITGRLVTTDNDPYQGGLYLADIIRASETDAPPLIAFSQETAPHAAQDENGYFIFREVPPGEYVLTLSNPIGQIILEGTGTGIPAIIIAKAGEKLELGEIVIP